MYYLTMLSNTLLATNLNKLPVEVKHSELKRFDSGPFKSICPVCKEGILLIRRNQETFELLSRDMCILCAQQVVYSDIEKLKEKDWLK